MNDVIREFKAKFRSHWIGVKFYDSRPDVNEVEVLKGVRFCQATKEAVLHPVLLDKRSLSCPGALSSFGWGEKINNNKEFFQRCRDKHNIDENNLNAILENAPCLKKVPSFIGLNTSGDPDLALSYVSPAQVMTLLNLYSVDKGESLDVSLQNIMSICSGVVCKAFLENKISISFGCQDSRGFAGIGRDSLAIGIPKSMFDLFLGKELAGAEKK